MVKTKYRVIAVREVGSMSRYLQFESEREIKRFPWSRKEKVRCWRFVPRGDEYIRRYVCDEECYLPTDSIHLWRCFSYSGDLWHEKHMHFSKFVERYPDIDDYFAMLNKKRDNYLDDKERDLESDEEYPKYF